MTEKKNCIPLGRVVVKAGQLMIGSPIHLSEWKGLGWNEMHKPYSYSLAGVCDACDLPEGGVIAPVCTCEVEDGACEFVPEDETDRYNAVGLGYAIPTTADDGTAHGTAVYGAAYAAATARHGPAVGSTGAGRGCASVKKVGGTFYRML